MTYAVFQILELKYALLLGIIMGLTNIIPYFGPIIGAIPVIAIAITVSGKMVIYALIAIFAIQLIEGNFFSTIYCRKNNGITPGCNNFYIATWRSIGWCYRNDFGSTFRNHHEGNYKTCFNHA